MERCRIALEVGTHSPWINRLQTKLGHEVIVANARQVKLISASSRKDDRLDAQMLARLARVDPKLLSPIRHRSEEAQADLNLIRVRAALVDGRTALVNAARGFSKASGERLPKCDTDQMDVERMAELPVELREVLKPLIEQVESMTETFVLTVEDKDRFAKSRDVGFDPDEDLRDNLSGDKITCLSVPVVMGLRPKRSESGQSQPQLRITKEGDVYLRKLLVQGAHYILGYRGPDTDLRRWGLKLAERGGKNARKRAIVAVARKLGVLMHHLWATGEVYEPLHNAQETASRKKAA
jgi:transposase